MKFRFETETLEERIGVIKMNWRTFEGFPETSICPVCGTNENTPCVLIAKVGTSDGNICEATPFHVDCINPANMLYDEKWGMIYFSDKERLEGKK